MVCVQRFQHQSDSVGRGTVVYAGVEGAVRAVLHEHRFARGIDRGASGDAGESVRPGMFETNRRIFM